MTASTAVGRANARTAGTRTRDRLWRWAPSLIPGLIMAVIGRYRLGHATFGWDELATLSAIRREPGQILDLAANFDGVIAPYYLLLHAWAETFGYTEVSLRTPSVLMMALGVGLAGELGRRLLTPAIGLLGGLILCTVPSLSYYAQEARSYGFAFALATAATLLCLRVTERPSAGRLAAYAITVWLAGLSQLFTLAVLGGHAVLVAYQARGVWKRWLVAAAAGVIACAPLIWLGARQQGDQLAWLRPVTWQTVLGAPAGIFGTRGNLAYDSRVIAIAFLVIGLALGVRGFSRAATVPLAALAALPSTALLAASLISPVWVPRYALSTLVPLALLAAATVAGPAPRASSWWRAVAVLTILGALAVSIAPSIRTPGAHQGGDYRLLARVIQDRPLPGAVIVYPRGDSWAPREAIGHYVPPDARPTDVLLEQTAAERGQLSASQRPITSLGQPEYVWYLRPTSPANSNPLSPEAHLDALRADYRLIDRWQTGRISLLLFQRR